MPPKKGSAKGLEAAQETASEPVDEVAEHQSAAWLVLSEEQYTQLAEMDPEQLARVVYDYSSFKARPVRVHTDILLEFVYHHLEFCILSKYTHQQMSVHMRIVQALFREAVLSEKAAEYTAEKAADWLQTELMKEVTQEWEDRQQKLFTLEQLRTAAEFIGSSVLRNLLAYQHAMSPLREMRHQEIPSEQTQC